MAGVLFFVGGIALALALAAGIFALLGIAASWALAHFGVHVAWYVCSVGVLILGSIFQASPR